MTRGKVKDPVKCTVDIRESSDINKMFFNSLGKYKNSEDTISLLTAILQPKYRNKSCTIDTGYSLISWKSTSLVSGEGILRVKKDVEKDVLVYEKKIPLIEPFHWMKYNERPIMPFLWSKQTNSILDPENQAYIDALGSSLVSKLSAHYNSPHFCNVYGCFRTIVDKFKYNLEEDLEEIRFTVWFWKAIEENELDLYIIEKNTGKRLSLEEIKLRLKPDDEYLEDSDDESGSDDYSGSDSDSGRDSGSDRDRDSDSDSDRDSGRDSDRDSGSDNYCESDEIEEIQMNTSAPGDMNNDIMGMEEVTFDDKSVGSDIIKLRKKSYNSTESSNCSDLSIYDDYDIYVELPEMPVVVLYSEKCEGTMDELLNNSDYAPVDSKEKERIWSAWLFQVTAALCQLQGGLRLTHNDLHTNNILWRKTTEEYLYYKDSSDRYWKVPTYGRIFTIIDFGRAIFSINNFFCISSDYQEGNNAAGQYNFGPLEDPTEPKVLPNKSFDLCRLSCSLLRCLFPSNPPSKQGSKIITKEKGWEVRETDYDLFNILWAWLKNDKGENILEMQSGREKHPGFDLYIEIAHTVHGATPAPQLNHNIMKQFITKSVSKDIKYIIIPL